MPDILFTSADIYVEGDDVIMGLKDYVLHLEADVAYLLSKMLLDCVAQIRSKQRAIMEFP